MPEQRLQRTRDSYDDDLRFPCTAFEGPPVTRGLADVIIAPDVMAAMTTTAAGLFNPPPDVAEKMAAASPHEHVWEPIAGGRVQCACGLDATAKEALWMYGGTLVAQPNAWKDAYK